jgi:hypothetical protein
MFVVVGVAVDDDVGAVWLAIDANHSYQRFAALVVKRLAALVDQRLAALVDQRLAALVSVHVRRPLVFHFSHGRSCP